LLDAAANNNLEMVKLFLDAKAEVNVQDSVT
jgi:ankyrin repeat protein